MRRTLEALERSGAREQLDEREVQRHRLAALLHDVGHYPFSHAVEHAIKNHYQGKLLVETGAVTKPVQAPKSIAAQEKPTKKKSPQVAKPPAKAGTLSVPERKFVTHYEHEALGGEILKHDAQLKGALADAGFEPDEISSVFRRESPQALTNLISSDLDADRIDYLLRTAHHAGLPYGSLDIDYILSQLRKDCEGKLCLGKKAVRAADHFFLCRYFDYTQVVFHKVVAGLEWVLEEVIGLLLRDGLDLSADGVKAHIKGATWSEIDDTLVIERARRLYERIKTSQPDDAALIECIVGRRPPVTIFAEESIEPRDSEKAFQQRVKQIDSALPGLVAKFGISQKLVHRWKRDLLLTEIGSKIPVSDMMVSAGSDGLAEAVLVEEEVGKPARPIMNLPYSLMKVLSDQQYRALRVYAVVPDPLRDKIDEMRSYFRNQVG